MRVLFVYSTDDAQSVEIPLRSWASIQFGISSISAVLKAHGHETRLLVLGSNQGCPDPRLLEETLEGFDPRVICFTAVSSQFPFLRKVAQMVGKRCGNRFLLVGGPHATLCPEEVIVGPFHALCVGEGEFPTLELCGQLAEGRWPRGIRNLWIRSAEGSLERNPPREFLPDLDALPFPDRDMWKPWIQPRPDDEPSVLAGRGCPFDCPYCSNHALRKTAPGDYVRLRSPWNILREVDNVHRQTGCRRLYFEVETISSNLAWTKDFCDHLARWNATLAEPVSFGCNLRVSPQTLDEQLFLALKRANVRRLNIGLESGSERVRREILHRPYSNEEFLKTVSLARTHGMGIRVYNMIGLPGETLSEHLETVALNRRVQPDWHSTELFHPYPGTRLYESCVQKGLLTCPIDLRRERKQPVLDLPGFSKSQQREAYTWFHYRVFRGHAPLLGILLSVLIVRVRSHPRANALFRRVMMFPIVGWLRSLFAKRARM